MTTFKAAFFWMFYRKQTSSLFSAFKNDIPMQNA